MESLVIKFKQNNKTRTAETYTASLNSFKKFRKDEDLMLDCLTSEIMEAYEAWHKSKGNTPNTISFYTRILRAVDNRAVEEEIRKMKHLDLSLTERLDFARDMFLMSFYLRGISFIDLAFLKKSDLKNGILSYHRRKTSQLLNIEWTTEMRILLDKYPENPTEYLMPIITNPEAKPRSTYRNVGYNINHNLKTIAQMIGINIP